MELESLPEEVVASLEVRDAWRRRTAQRSAALEFVISDLARWHPSRPVRVAFLDGDTALHADIVAATAQITDACGLLLDFGHDEATGTYRRWTEQDTEYAAEIRVSFDLGGYFSLVGTDSNDPTLGRPGDAVGGGPGMRSLNLGGYVQDRPSDWEGTVRHEFLHALAFHHAHQNLRGPCADDFRWEDDEGYVPTTNARGVFVPDSAGRSPGIYTYLAGPPNRWSRAKVDHNLKVDTSDDVVVGPFDSDSVMLYQFEAFFYRTSPSACAPTGNGIDLSEGDKRGLQLLYPSTGEVDDDTRTKASAALSELVREQASESTGGERSVYDQRVMDLLAGWSG